MILNDDVLIEAADWIEQMVMVLESEPKIACVGELRRYPHCPPFGGWVDGWCMLFRTQALARVFFPPGVNYRKLLRRHGLVQEFLQAQMSACQEWLARRAGRGVRPADENIPP